MNTFFIIFILSLLSCFIFFKIKVDHTIKVLIKSYHQQIKITFDKTLEDTEKQKELFRSIKTQLKYLSILSIKLVLSIVPFCALHFLHFIGINFNLNDLTSAQGITASIISITLFIMLKNSYARLFKS
jgi:hypothetical protein